MGDERRDSGRPLALIVGDVPFVNDGFEIVRVKPLAPIVGQKVDLVMIHEEDAERHERWLNDTLLTRLPTGKRESITHNGVISFRTAAAEVTHVATSAEPPPLMVTQQETGETFPAPVIDAPPPMLTGEPETQAIIDEAQATLDADDLPEADPPPTIVLPDFVAAVVGETTKVYCWPCYDAMVDATDAQSGVMAPLPLNPECGECGATRPGPPIEIVETERYDFNTTEKPRPRRVHGLCNAATGEVLSAKGVAIALGVSNGEEVWNTYEFPIQLPPPGKRPKRTDHAALLALFDAANPPEMIRDMDADFQRALDEEAERERLVQVATEGDMAARIAGNNALRSIGIGNAAGNGHSPKRRPKKH